MTKEWQFDGLVGPSHNYSGLSFGNVASEINKNSVSNPKAAALQGLAKMRFVAEKTQAQGFFLPQHRCIVSELKRVGFSGNIAYMLEQAAAHAPELLASVTSAASMWAANAATVAPSVDTADGKLHITPANLLSKYHRSLEAPSTTRMLRRIFHNARYFSVHDPLPATLRFADEGAANHMRLATRHADKGWHVFIYGTAEGAASPARYPARQHEEACRAIARLHQLDPDRCFFVQQNPEAIDAGIFHHDVIGMSGLMFMAQHVSAWMDGKRHLNNLAYKLNCDAFYLHESGTKELFLGDAVKSYLYNSQLLSDESGIEIIAPSECLDIPQAKALFDGWVAGDAPVRAVHYLDVRESMRNGGGPACLRLRVVMTAEESAAMHQGVVLTESKAHALEAWVHKHYRDRLCFDDLRDPYLIREMQETLDALTQIVDMPNLYSFQTN